MTTTPPPSAEPAAAAPEPPHSGAAQQPGGEVRAPVPAAPERPGEAAVEPERQALAGSPRPPPSPRPPRWAMLAHAAVLAVAVAAGVLAWRSGERAQALEAELARRQPESSQAVQAAQEARVLARQAEAATRELAAKVTLLDGRVAETAMQRSQFEDLLQSLARSRDENVLADMEAALRVAQQQSAITGSAEPLLQVLRQADERLARYAQPRLERVRRAVAQDLERTRGAGIVDVATLAIRLDEVVRQVDELPLLVVPPQAASGRRSGAAASDATATVAPALAGASRPAAVASASTSATPTAPAMSGTGTMASVPTSASAGALAGTDAARSPIDALRQGWQRFAAHLWAEARALVRITPIATPEAMLLAPEQAWYLRENLKLRLLNARLALMSRQFDTAQSDLRDAQAAIERYFDRGARRTALTQEALRQVAAQARTVVVPRPDATLAAIATAAAGR